MSTVLIDSDVGDKVFRIFFFLFPTESHTSYFCIITPCDIKEKYIGFLKIPTLLAKCVSWKSELAIL